MTRYNKHATTRFSNTVDAYVKYRPSYPVALIELLKRECQLSEASVVADIGSGTGILTKQLLDTGATVYGVEPNTEMREAAEVILKSESKFFSVNGTAEETTLDDQTINLVTAAQAFHWFDQVKVKAEFQRIIKPGGFCALIWNFRDDKNSALMAGYHAMLLKHGKDYDKVMAENISDDEVSAFFAPHELKTATFKNIQCFDWESFKGRLLSTSYSLKPGEPGFEAYMAAAKELFDQHQKNDRVEFLYRCVCYYGHFI